MKITILTAALIAMFAFGLGLKAGRWDAKHGYETGKRHGEMIRAFWKGFRGYGNE